MRIISGIHKGRGLKAPKKLPVRPTTDRSKEALFNIIQHQIEFSEITVLDLFSGTGSISYEFASRGVTQLTAVDRNKHCIQFIQSTAESLAMDIRIIQKDCFAYLMEDKGRYDLIFADPPYEFDLKTYENIITLALKRLSSQGQLIIEHFNKIDLSEFKMFASKRNYGSATFSFFTI
ncbi:MAG: 16S rRNA (guanine(966)-N(2))-methyltransferase RsmD [Flavobacteriaceae bacterium]|nr:16S rRNA (guanine(966)-N(2))-methyltransferase RsmD [Flavobacteriaceae bacterium]|tara:strand:+ start:3971 stop:4501 length:531 start_codon:yes stop_codon:yes gene_type:complete